MPDPSHDEIKQDLLTNPRYTALFAPYHPEAVARFARDYASHKFNWQWQGPKAEHAQTEALTEPSEAAYNRLWAQYFGAYPPCRTTLEVRALPTPIAIELQCIAYLGARP